MHGQYRGYTLTPITTKRGWSMLIGDPAGHPADVMLHHHFGHNGWQTLSDADHAAHDFIDAVRNQNDSY